ncbi:MAG: hypothetical protein ACJAYG_000138 [Oceanicoccus sp.]|jgi:hypothetical protein
MKTEKLSFNLDALLAGDWLQCQALLNACYNTDNTDNSAACTNNQQLTALLCETICRNEVLPHVNEQLAGHSKLDQNNFSLLRFSDQFFDNYLKNCKLHPQLARQLNPLRSLIAQALLQQQLPWLERPALIKTLNLIQQHCLGWTPELGRASDKFLAQLSSLVTARATATTNIDAALEPLSQFFVTQQQRVKKLEQRLIDAELGSLHAKYAQQLSAKTLNQHMAGKKLPAEITSFLQGPWRESMRLIIISDGKNSARWQQVLSLTDTLCWSLQPIDCKDPERRQQAFNSVADINDQLRELSIGLHHDSAIDEELAAIEQQHLKVLKGEALDYQPFSLINNSDPLLSPQVILSNSLIKQVESFNEGQWFIQQQEQGAIRIKLTTKNDQAQQLLFTNFIGMKVAQYSFEEFACLLSSKIISAIKAGNPLKATGEKMLASLLQYHQQQQQQADIAAATQLVAQKQQYLTRKAAREKALTEAKAHAEAQRFARHKSIEQERNKNHQIHQQQKRADITRQLKTLRVGAIIIFYGDDNEINASDQKRADHCKLAAILQTSAEYIFVDRVGIKKHSLDINKLTDRLLNKTAKIIDIGSSFDNTLEQVVNNLRARKKS